MATPEMLAGSLVQNEEIWGSESGKLKIALRGSLMRADKEAIVDTIPTINLGRKPFSSNPDLKDAIEEIQKLMQKGKTEEAVSKFEKLWKSMAPETQDAFVSSVLESARAKYESMPLQNPITYVLSKDEGLKKDVARALLGESPQLKQLEDTLREIAPAGEGVDEEIAKIQDDILAGDTEKALDEIQDLEVKKLESMGIPEKDAKQLIKSTGQDRADLIKKIAATSADVSPIEKQIDTLVMLRNDGVLTDAEFEKAFKELTGMDPADAGIVKNADGIWELPKNKDKLTEALQKSVAEGTINPKAVTEILNSKWGWISRKYETFLESRSTLKKIYEAGERHQLIAGFMCAAAGQAAGTIAAYAVMNNNPDKYIEVAGNLADGLTIVAKSGSMSWTLAIGTTNTVKTGAGSKEGGNESEPNIPYGGP